MERARNAVLGALVADAASLGLHWIYDPARIAEVAGDAPEFVEPDVAHYKGVTGYFAHKGKQAGDSTHYGEQLMVCLRSLAACGGELDTTDYERRFFDTFGPGGSWVGYIDYATRVTLRNIDQAVCLSITAAREFDLDAYEAERPLMESKVMAAIQKWRGDQLLRAMDKAVEVTHPGNEEMRRIGREMARMVETAREGFHGADDVQLPAVSKLPPVVARYAGAPAFDKVVESAVRVTNDNDDALGWALPIAHMLEAAVQGSGPREAALAAAAVDPRMQDAFVFDGDAAEQYGLACTLAQAAPLILTMVRDADGFEHAIRANIRAGGESAGRAIVLGAVLGAAFGVPEEWVERTRAASEAAELLASL